MNQPICPLPFATVSEQGAVEGPSLFRASEKNESSDFGDLLDSELEEKASEQKDAEECDAAALYGLLGHLQSFPPESPLLVPVAAAESAASVLPSEEFDLASANATPEAGEQILDDSPAEAVAAFVVKREVALDLILRGLKPAQQILPVQNFEETPPAEQIAGKVGESAEKSSGIPAAQVPAMLFASQKEEETALRQGNALGEAGEDASSAATEILATVQTEASAPRREFEPAEFAPVAPVTPEWSSFEDISEVGDIQTPRKLEGAEMVEAIRTHVELLKGSTEKKMDVILRPDGQTELRLHVEKVNGQILVQARCDRGDFARLEANWSAIQQSLGSQGVRVEALQNGVTLNNDPQSWNHSGSSEGQQFDSREENKSRFIEQENSNPKRPKQAVATNGSGRGWQSWA